MALDHYVSQVHLRNFYSPALGNRMFAIRKANLKTFRCNSQSVCRIEEGNTNAYLINDRAIEDFLLDVEPKYNASLEKLRKGAIDKECVYAIAGFVGYVACCAPAAMRIHAAALQGTMEVTAALLDRQGVIPKAPPELGSKSLTELLADGTVNIKVDDKYPQALGISGIVGHVSIFGNSPWEILRNSDTSSPFFTSDYPVAIEATSHQAINWIVPLAPDLAIRIFPDVNLSGTMPDLSFAKFTSRQRTLPRAEIAHINRLIVRCAEDLIFYCDGRAWIGNFVARNRHYRVESVTDKIPTPSGFMNISRQRIMPYQQLDALQEPSGSPVG